MLIIVGVHNTCIVSQSNNWTFNVSQGNNWVVITHLMYVDISQLGSFLLHTYYTFDVLAS